MKGGWGGWILEKKGKRKEKKRDLSSRKVFPQLLSCGALQALLGDLQVLIAMHSTWERRKASRTRE
jgi:hypothetical protein